MDIIDDILMPAKSIAVIAVAASVGGTLSVLNDFYAAVKNHSDKSVKWTLAISLPHLDEAENIKVIRVPWIKKNWLFRLFFDWFCAPKIIKQCGADVVFSLQGTVFPRVKARQVIFMDQPVYFCDRRFSLGESPSLWLRQHSVIKFIRAAVKKADAVIVQTKWIKAAVAKKADVPEEKIKIIPTDVAIEPKAFFSYNNANAPVFIYPASSSFYKNHQVIIEACKLLKKEGKANFRVIFTISGTESKHSSSLKKESEKHGLPIEFGGMLKREVVFDWYTKAALLFPSYLESFGLPLLEARMHRTPIIAADTPFAREILEGYDRCSFFAYDDPATLAAKIKELVQAMQQKTPNA